MSIERPSPYELWRQANGDRDEYRRLLREHGHLIDRQPGDDPDLPCGWPGKATGGVVTQPVPVGQYSCVLEAAATPALPWRLKHAEGWARAYVNFKPALGTPLHASVAIRGMCEEFTADELEQYIAALSEAVRQIRREAAEHQR